MITFNNEVNAIEVRNVSKMFKKYKNNASKILDLFGLNFSKNYEEFWPLKNINLIIKKGEKVGVIGRNGAGKTTLLSMVSDNLKPTEGSIKVNGKVNALFVLGTGFHPEFTGRQNIRSSLAFQGITGGKAKELEKEIIEFTELEDFIDQPLKTYSAGMYTRLAFTVATAIEPEVLIIDEILGAGDAYFNSKALARMNSLTNSGATVIFVSHDLSAVQKICDRCIWIDKGKIREDGNTLDVIKSYSLDVRRREELRLQSQNSGVKIENEENSQQILFRFITSNGTAPKTQGFRIAKINLYFKGKLYHEILVGDSMDNSPEQDGYLITDKKINWSGSKNSDGIWFREFKDQGGEYVHAVGIFKIPLSAKLRDFSFSIEYFDKFEDDISFDVFDSGKNSFRTLATFKSHDSESWICSESIFLIDPLLIEASPEIKTHEEESDVVEDEAPNDVYGTGELIITDFQTIDAEEKQKYVFTMEETMSFRISFNCFESISNPVFVIAIYKPDGEIVTQLIDKFRGYTKGQMPKNGFVDFKLDKIRIGRGEYLISVGVFHDVDLSNPVEQKTYCLHDRKYKFKIEQPFGINMDLGLVSQDFSVTYRDK